MPHTWQGGADYFASIVVSGGLHNAGVMAPSPQRTKSRFVRVQVELEGRGQRVLQSQDTVFLFLLGRSTIEKGAGIQMIFAERGWHLRLTQDTPTAPRGEPSGTVTTDPAAVGVGLPGLLQMMRDSGGCLTVLNLNRCCPQT